VKAACSCGNIVWCRDCRKNERQRRRRNGLPPLPPRPKRTEELFWAKADKSGDCWIWTAAVGKDGYAKAAIEGKVMHASRAAYQFAIGPIPEGLVIDHLCSNTLCVNPAHLEAVTQRENVLRSRNFAAKQARQTECIHGHPFTPENTYVHRGHRYCRTCRNHRWMEMYRRRKALA
jgi:hypothetical protein